MKIFAFSTVLMLIMITGFKTRQEDNVELVCMKTLKATNTCHYNFKIDGAKFRFVDSGCKYTRNKNEVIKKAKEGTLALAKDWKIDCPEVKQENQKQETPNDF